ncbi:MAG: DHH family phosphoesterase [Candidatus Helarchaeota archaeon]
MNKFNREILASYGIPEQFAEKAERLAEKLYNWNRSSKVLVISHRDGDGISAVSIIYQALKSLGFSNFDIKIMLSPDLDELLNYIKKLRPNYVFTSDIGADFEDILNTEVDDYIITDHHPSKDNKYHENQLNPIPFDINDENDASGSTTVFFVIYPLFKPEFWLTQVGKIILCYAISGAISDFQLQPNKEAHCVNKFVLEFAAKNKAVEIKKDIAIFGRSLYPIYLAIHYANIPGFEDQEIANILINSEIEAKLSENKWKRIIDLDISEKSKLMEIILNRLMEVKVKKPSKLIKEEIIGWVYDMIGLYGFDCTYLEDGRYTLDAREILHRINYCCRRGYADLAIELLNNKEVDPFILEQIESLHKEGDSEVATALDLYSRGEIPHKSWKDQVILLDFSGHIFYDEVGVVAGVIMKANKNIQIILSACAKDDELIKVSVRARDKIWESIDNSNQLSDGRKIFQLVKSEYPNDIEFGGHRWAFSSYVKKHILEILFNRTKNYYLELKNPINNQYIYKK